MLIFAIMLIAAGIILAGAPNLIYDIMQSWKNFDDSEPSDYYRVITRVQGIILIIAGIVLIVRYC